MTRSQTRGSTPTPTTDEDLTPVEDPTVDLPGFQPIPGPTADPLDPTATTISQTTTGGDGAGWVDDLDEGPTSSTTATSRSSQASTDLPELEEIARTLVGLASMLVRAVRSRTKHLAPGVWLADKDDRGAIGDPLARIAARHAPVGGKGSEDVVDGLTVLVGTFGYAMKGVEGEAQAPELVVDEAPADAATGVGY